MTLPHSSAIAPKRRRADMDGADDIIPSSLLTADDVKLLGNSFKQQTDLLLSWLSNEKDTARKASLRTAIEEIFDGFHKMSSSYLVAVALADSTKVLKKALDQACDNIFKASENVSATVSGIEKIANVTQRTYASVTRQSSGALSSSGRSNPSQAHKVALVRGKTFALTDAKRVYIGPREQMKDRFATSAATKQALTATIRPAQQKIGIRRLLHGPNCSVIIEGDESLDEEVFINNQALAEAGLEVKQPQMLNPRIIVHDVPVSLSGDEIIRCLVDQNFSNADYSDFKVVYLYPARDKKQRSCVIEMSPEHRRSILAKKKICIEWSICRVNDHVTIAQCFSCNGFGHVASACKSRVCCALCAGEHHTKDCKTKDNLKCVNCASANLGNANHAANDKGNCPILRRKIERKIMTINYGGN